ncbi:hypothetical protein, conserved [Leishmania tarentolae]|uniref:RING-type domain-containing protein n=1 Tax=Leishmania tarentolae TaxID=5689 RepID=A0A640KEV4_LEITA|nr:hypothetical protein, conserved [Leishmania tarentolae]
MGESAAMANAIPLLKSTHAHCVCSVCLDVFRSPTCFPCGHILCRACATRCIAARPRCPLCNQAVPNLRHCVPLPQLSLFCVLTRAVGLRVSGPHLRSSVQDAAMPVPDSDHGSSLKRHRDATGDDDAVAMQEAPQPPQPRQFSLSPPPKQRFLSFCEPHVPHSGLDVGTVIEGRTENYAQQTSLPEFLSAEAGETQRLHSASPSPSPSRESEGDALSDVAMHHAIIAHTTVSLPSSVAHHPKDRSALGQGQDRPLTPTPPPALSPSPAPFSTPLRLVRNHITDHADQLDSTPRLSPPPFTAFAAAEAADGTTVDVTSQSRGQASSEVFTAEDTSGSKKKSTWSVWRRGQGVVHCILTPPAARLLAQHAGAADGVDRSKTENASTATPLWSASTDPAASFWHRLGCCVLCGLDVVQRTSVRQRLQQLLRSPTAHCDPAELAIQTEETLSLLLGPLWAVCCEVQPHSTDIAQSRDLMGDGEYTTTEFNAVQESYCCGCRGEAAAHHLTGVAHHNCLAWAGLIDFFTNTSFEDLSAAAAVGARFVPRTTASLHMTVPLQDPLKVLTAHTSGRVARWQLLAATLWHMHQLDAGEESEPWRGVKTCGGSGGEGPLMPPCCALCEGGPRPLASSSRSFSFGAGLRTCEGTERGESSCGQQYHYPCALLAGASACIVFGLEEECNIMGASADIPVVSRNAGGKRSGLRLSVEAWCGVCHERHKAHRRRV